MISCALHPIPKGMGLTAPLINILPPHLVFKTIEDAIIYGIICFIEEKEPNIIINKNMDVFDQYDTIEKKHPDLILKYMDYIIVG